MEFKNTLISGLFLKRYKRFFDIKIKDKSLQLIALIQGL